MNKREKIRVMVVDDHPVVREGLLIVLSVTPDMECVAEAQSGEEALQQCAKVRPDVILMDILLPGMDGVTTTKRIREQYPETQVIVLTNLEDQEQVTRALQAGAIGYLLKNVSMNALSSAIRSAHAGQSTFSAEATRTFLRPAFEPKDKEPEAQLSDRELEVLALLAEGLTNVAISHELHISKSTTRYHVSNILSKLAAKNRTEAVRQALDRDLLP